MRPGADAIPPVVTVLTVAAAALGYKGLRRGRWWARLQGGPGDRQSGSRRSGSLESGTASVVLLAATLALSARYLWAVLRSAGTTVPAVSRTSLTGFAGCCAFYLAARAWRMLRLKQSETRPEGKLQAES